MTADGCWADFRITRDAGRGRPCLFLDRDGVLIEDTGYPHRREDVILIDAMLALVGMAHRLGYVTGIVTNQSGIGRGLFGWPAFADVQDRIDAALRVNGIAVDFVLACPHHPDAAVPRYRHGDHPWRKPNPDMLRAAAQQLDLDLSRSIMLGDRISDMEAAAAAGVRHLWCLAGATAPKTTPPGVVIVGREDAAPMLMALDGEPAESHRRPSNI